MTKFFKEDFDNLYGLSFCPDCEVLVGGLDYRLKQEGLHIGGSRGMWESCGCAFKRNGNCPDCGRPMTYGSCRWSDCGESGFA